MRGHYAVLVLAAVFGLAGCAETTLFNHAAKSVIRGGEPGQAGAGKGGIYKVGNPYQINGVWYYPKEDPNYDETGIGSWYGEQFHGKQTANGEIFDMNEVTAAHPTLPMPSLVRVTNLENGRSIVVRMNDRGPYANNRIIDLSRRSAQLLGYERQGTAKVRVQYIGPAPLGGEAAPTMVASRGTGGDERPAAAPRGGVSAEALPPPPGAKGRSAEVAKPAEGQPSPMQILAAQRPQGSTAAAPAEAATDLKQQKVEVGPARGGQIYVQVGAFTLHENAHKLAAQMSLIGPANVSSTFVNKQEFFRVRLGPFNQVAAADQALQQVISNGQTNARIVVE
ncbi:MAG: septal ring lytic transglycosylase RlpA family protein [Ferrovibrio sp.]|uniref:septal ring lytic transglycosylase RlpA family protein n=1 Tax=Ferrovibrio sp. TaxID=1917215 RepID=UPI00391DC343